MTVLPSPVPNPLDYCPFDLPHGAGEALDWVVGFDWPQGNEVTTWDLADRWYALGTALAEPHRAAFTAAAQLGSGYGAAADGFLAAWQRLSADENAPLNALLQIAHELGALVEECGARIEAAKLEAWIEIGTFLTELIGMAVVLALTLGAATPAAGGLIAATRVAVQQIFQRLVDQLGPQAAEKPPVGTRPSSWSPPDLSGTKPPVRPLRPPAPGRDEDGHVGYARQARRAHEQNRRTEYAGFLETVAEGSRAKLLDLDRRAEAALRGGSAPLGEDHRRRAAELRAIVADLEARVELARSGESVPATVDVDPQSWARINAGGALPAPGGVGTGDRSALTGDDAGPPIDQTRRYHSPGGLRAPLAVQQRDLENAMPRDGDGRVSRLADPRSGEWFRLANDGGPESDPTRGLNCLDGVLALYDTYIHGRPRVSAPRTFDAYTQGDPNRPVGGEEDGLKRIRLATGTTFQNLCPFVGDAHPAEARTAVDTAMRNLTNHLHNSGHGTFAFIITDLAGGGCHSWAAVNQNGTVLFLDPQVGRVAEEAPLYRHYGVPGIRNVVSMDALVVNGQGEPAPLPYHGPGQWTALDPAPIGTGVATIDPDQQRALESLTPAERAALSAAVVAAEPPAGRILADLQEVVHAVRGTHRRVVDDDHRVRSLGSLARMYRGQSMTSGATPATFLRDVPGRVRFTVEIGEEDYGRAVNDVLDGLRRRGYEVSRLDSFWTPRGRHHGLTVDLRSSDGLSMAIQFPTPLSRELGQNAHGLYEIVRQVEFGATDRVEAFLEILSINKRAGIHRHRPLGLDLLSDARPVDTTFGEWMGKLTGLREAYVADLLEQGETFEQVLHRHGLDASDLGDIEGMGLIDDEHVRLSTGDAGGPDHGEQPDRLPDPGPAPAASDRLERPGPDLDLRPGGGGRDPLRRSGAASDPTGGPRHRRADHDRDVQDGVALRARTGRDVLGGGADGLGLRSADELTAPRRDGRRARPER